MKWIAIIVTGIIALWMMASVGAFVLQDRLLFHPTQAPLRLPPTGVDAIELVTPDGETIHAFYRPAARAECPTIMFLHGNGGRIDRNIYRFDGVAPFGWGLMLLEWRGYSGATGKPSEAGFHIDARTGWDWLTSEGGLAPDKIIIHGLSIGSGPATKLARDVTPAALVLSAPYYSMLDLLAKHKSPLLPVGAILKHTFRTDKWIGEVTSPILIAHGTQDKVIPPSQSEKLVPLINAPYRRWVTPDANHDNLAVRGLYDVALVTFLKTHGQDC